MEKLSLPGTWVFKLLFPGGFTAIVVGALGSQVGGGPIRAVMLAALAATAFLALLWWSCLPLKTVALDHDHLVISNYLREVVVPVSEIVGVRRNWDSWRSVTITLATPTAFGSKVRFMPDFSGQAVERLRSLKRGSQQSA